MRKYRQFVFSILMICGLSCALTAQVRQADDIAPLTNWMAPLYWQPTHLEAEIALPSQPGSVRAAQDTRLPEATMPSGALVFVGMTPCRVVDTRASYGFPAPFGAPSLVGSVTRTFPMQASPNCPIPSIAQAYSLNVTVVPQGSLWFLTIWPTGQARPNASTLNAQQGQVLANAAIVPAGSGASVDVFASQATDLVIDINGYYATPTGLTLAQGSAAAPSLSFSGDAGTGIYSSGAGALNIATGGTSRLTVRSDGDLDITGGIRKNGTLLIGADAAALNTSVGLLALASKGSGGGNTAVGSGALLTNTTGTGNTAVGNAALSLNNSGGNSALGEAALQLNTTGHHNTAIGAGAMNLNIAGYNNTATGRGALYSSTGSYNTAVGMAALQDSTIGENNTALGAFAGAGITSGGENIMIANLGSSGDANTTRIGNESASGFLPIILRTFIAGIRGRITGKNDAIVMMIDSNGQIGTASSSRRSKQDIREIGDLSNGLQQLRPVAFRYKQHASTGSERLEFGLIAEEVAEIFPDLVVTDKDGRPETVQYQKLTPMLLNEFQKLHSELQREKEHNRDLESRLAALEALLSRKELPGGGER